MKDTKGQHDPVLKFLREMHKNKTIGDQLCRRNNVCSSSSGGSSSGFSSSSSSSSNHFSSSSNDFSSSSGSSSSSSDSTGSALNHCILRDWAIVGTNNGHKGKSKSQNEMWSVYDYTLVWGKRHAYAAASITVTLPYNTFK